VNKNLPNPLVKKNLGRRELRDGRRAGEAMTKQEQQAAGRKGTRQLTREAPAPQTIYRVSPADNKAFVVNVHFQYSK